MVPFMVNKQINECLLRGSDDDDDDVDVTNSNAVDGFQSDDDDDDYYTDNERTPAPIIW